MRTLIRAVTTRYGVAGLLVLGVLLTVGVARWVGGEAERPGRAAPGSDPYASVSFGPDDGVVGEPTESDDPRGSPSLPPGATDPRPVAQRFATAWADHEGVAADAWRERLAAHATEALMRRLANTDPAAVPTDRITGEPTLTHVTGRGLAEVSLRADGGVLVLGLVRADNGWAVDAVDWRRG